MRKKLLIFGTSVYAKMVCEYFENSGQWSVEGFVVDKEYYNESFVLNKPVVTMDEVRDRYSIDEYYCYVAVGYSDMNKLRGKKIEEFRGMGYKLATYIDASAHIMPSVKIGENCFIMEMVVVQPNTIIEDGVHIFSGSIIGHNVLIEKYAFITAGCIITGFSTIGRNSFIGSNSTISNYVNVAEFTLIGASSFISKNTKKYGVYIAKNTKDAIKDIENREDMQLAFLK